MTSMQRPSGRSGHTQLKREPSGFRERLHEHGGCNRLVAKLTKTDAQVKDACMKED